tara:strand:+ start:645 stop:1211 length:567 start_codon:yes stop_codon:yes gene_type:complete
MTKLSPIIEAPSQELSSVSKKSPSKKSASKKSPSRKSPSKKSPSKKSPSKKSLNKKSVSKKYIEVDEWMIPSYLTRSHDSNKIKYKKFKSLLKKNNVPINDEKSYPARLYRNKQLIKFCKEQGVDPSDIDSKYNDWQSLLKNVKYTDIIKKLFEAQDIDNTGGRKRKRKSKRKSKSKRKNKFGGSKGG